VVYIQLICLDYRMIKQGRVKRGKKKKKAVRSKRMMLKCFFPRNKLLIHKICFSFEKRKKFNYGTKF